MAVTPRAAAAFDVAATTKLNTTVPAAAQVGDVAVVLITTNAANSVITPPAGWTQIGAAVSSQSQTTARFRKVLVAGDINVAQEWNLGAAAKWLALLSVWAGVDTADIVGGEPAPTVYTSVSNRNTFVTPAFAYPAGSLVIEWAVTRGTDPGAMTIPGTHTQIVSRASTGAGACTAVMATTTTDLDGGNTFGSAAGWPQGAAGGLWLKAGAVAPSPGAVNHMRVGAPTASSVRVKARTTGATSVQLAVSTSADMSSPTFLAAQAPDAYGYVSFIATGLAADTRHYFRLADTPSGGSRALVGPTGTIRTLAGAGAAITTRRIVLGSCIRTGGQATEIALADAAAWNPHYGLFLGDFFYNGDGSINEAAWITKHNNQIGSVPNLAGLLAAGGAAFSAVSDHDTMAGDNGDSNGPQAPFEQAAWRRTVPFLPTVDADTRDQTWTDGRFGFYLLDVRSPNRSPGLQADGPGKTMLGAAQKARLLAWLHDDPAPFKIIASDVAWRNPASTSNGEDKWWSYANERAQIAAAINAAKSDADSPTVHVELWHGDSHLIGYITPQANADGGFPIICAAPYDETGGGRGANLFTEYFNNGSTTTHQYGRITLTDDGQTMTRTFEGWGEGQIRMTYTTPVVVPSHKPAAYLADGTPLDAFLWEGGQMVPLDFLDVV